MKTKPKGVNVCERQKGFSAEHNMTAENFQTCLIKTSCTVGDDLFDQRRWFDSCCCSAAAADLWAEITCISRQNSSTSDLCMMHFRYKNSTVGLQTSRHNSGEWWFSFKTGGDEWDEQSKSGQTLGLRVHFSWARTFGHAHRSEFDQRRQSKVCLFARGHYQTKGRVCAWPVTVLAGDLQFAEFSFAIRVAHKRRKIWVNQNAQTLDWLSPMRN